MIYETEKIKRIVEYKDTINNIKIQKDIEWLLSRYNDFFINSREYEEQRNNYNNLLNKYYNAEDEKANLKENLKTLRNKYNVLKQLHNDSCKNKKSMI